MRPVRLNSAGQAGVKGGLDNFARFFSERWSPRPQVKLRSSGTMVSYTWPRFRPSFFSIIFSTTGDSGRSHSRRTGARRARCFSRRFMCSR